MITGIKIPGFKEMSIKNKIGIYNKMKFLSRFFSYDGFLSLLNAADPDPIFLISPCVYIINKARTGSSFVMDNGVSPQHPGSYGEE